ncbi:MAG: DUF4116 domain-containing protein [Bacilli bacterium]|nr:DUF4116 domain-containing protein [Bacilli bacterium]
MIINLINLIDITLERYDQYMENLEEIFDDFSDELDSSFTKEQIIDNLKIISNLNEKNIFMDKKYFTQKYQNNEIRILIENYINENCKIFIDYLTVKTNIKNNYKLFLYLNSEDKNDINKIDELILLNPKVIFLLEYNIINKDFIIKNMQQDKFIGSVFAGEYGFDNFLYEYSICYKDVEDIQNLLYIQLLDELKKDVYKYIDYSPLAKSNIGLAKEAISLEPKMIAYIGKDLYNNKEFMLQMVKKDINNMFYISSNLKNDAAFQAYIDLEKK